MKTKKCNDNQILAAIDIGAGLGAKIAIAGFADYESRCLCEKTLDRKEYGFDPILFTNKLSRIIKEMMRSCDLDFSRLCSVGVSIPGLIDKDQNIIFCNNLPFLDSSDITTPLSKDCNANVSIINDGDSGTLAQWNIHKCELLYWAFGGGWGGAWINREGSIQFPTINWNGKDQSIHLTNDPGYILKMPKKKLESFFKAHHASWDRFLENFTREMSLEPDKVTGPDNDPDSLLAEICSSGTGLWRIYHSLVLKDDLKKLPQAIKDFLMNPGTAGAMIFKRYIEGDKTSGKAVSLFSRILGEAAVKILKKASDDGAGLNTPVYLGGGLAKSFDLFAPQVQQVLKTAGIQSKINPCHFLMTGQNANLIGAFCLAAKNRV